MGNDEDSHPFTQPGTEVFKEDRERGGLGKATFCRQGSLHLPLEICIVLHLEREHMLALGRGKRPFLERDSLELLQGKEEIVEAEKSRIRRRCRAFFRQSLFIMSFDKVSKCLCFFLNRICFINEDRSIF